MPRQPNEAAYRAAYALFMWPPVASRAPAGLRVATAARQSNRHHRGNQVQGKSTDRSLCVVFRDVTLKRNPVEGPEGEET